MSIGRRRFVAAVLTLSLSLGLGAVGAVPASAGFPGTNGQIAFRSDRDGDFEVFVMAGDGTGQVPLTSSGAWDGEPAFSPDGTRIAFQSQRDGNDDIYVMNADGTGQTPLTTSPGYDAAPAWSPDGTRIAFATDRDGNDDIYVMNPDGTGQTRVTVNTVYDAEPDWSPDGARIAFLSDRDGNGEIYVMNADGTGQTRLTTTTANEYGPAWQPIPANTDTGTVDATVTMVSTAVCLELSTSTIDFGTRRFAEVRAPASPVISVDNCGEVGESILIRGTNAHGPGSSAWNLVDTGTCADATLGPDEYRLTLNFPIEPTSAIPLSLDNNLVLSFGPVDPVEFQLLLDTPCPGSSGAGEEMTMQILFTAIEEVQ